MSERCRAVKQRIADASADLFGKQRVATSRVDHYLGGKLARLSLCGKAHAYAAVSGGEQQLNAQVLGNIGGAVVIDQNDATPERLLGEVTRLIQTPGELEGMGKRASSAASPDAAQRLTDLILQIAAEHRQLGN